MLIVVYKRLLLLGALCFMVDFSGGQNIGGLNMDRSEPYKIIQGRSKTELQKFASWFHQDWKMIFPDFFEGTALYLRQISLQEKKELRRELKQFFEENKSSSASQLKQKWLSLGAQGWQSKLDIHNTLNEFILMIEDSWKE